MMKAGTKILLTALAVVGLATSLWAANEADQPETMQPETTKQDVQAANVCPHEPDACPLGSDACSHVQCQGLHSQKCAAMMSNCEHHSGTRGTGYAQDGSKQNRCGHWYSWIPGHEDRCDGRSDSDANGKVCC